MPRYIADGMCTFTTLVGVKAVAGVEIAPSVAAQDRFVQLGVQSPQPCYLHIRAEWIVTAVVTHGQAMLPRQHDLPTAFVVLCAYPSHPLLRLGGGGWRDDDTGRHAHTL